MLSTPQWLARCHYPPYVGRFSLHVPHHRACCNHSSALSMSFAFAKALMIALKLCAFGLILHASILLSQYTARSGSAFLAQASIMAEKVTTFGSIFASSITPNHFSALGKSPPFEHALMTVAYVVTLASMPRSCMSCIHRSAPEGLPLTLHA